MLRITVFIFSIVITVAHATGCVDWPSDVLQPIQNSKTHQIAPDYGFYWFKMQNDKEVVAKAFLPPNLEPQFSNGQLNQLPAHETVTQARLDRLKWLETQGFFDPSKPTMVFIHGVQTNETQQHHRFDFCYQFPIGTGESPVYDALPFWKDWNVAVFYWNQFADVQHQGFLHLGAILEPETRIYNSQGSGGMKWVYLSGKQQLATCRDKDKRCMPMPKNKAGKPFSIAELAFLAYQNLMPESYHQPLWISGFSLGNQIAILLTQSIVAHPQLVQPEQLILLDPYYTPNFYKINIGDKKVAIAPYDKAQVDKILATNHQLALSFYRSSTVSSGLLGDQNVPLQQEAAYLHICPTYLASVKGELANKLKHVTALYYYFYSKHFPLAFNNTSSTAFCASHITANSQVAQVKALVGQTRLCQLNDFGKGCEDVKAVGECQYPQS